ncbi:class I SAM-dependent methyltransferase [Arthrobacter sp. UYEF3]|uniref:class I SAM-dependent methyltransferase n=1 Tax=Arthrobacter sp. UYEF3 TaxID=1756365 RepID=UPI00339A27C3
MESPTPANADNVQRQLAIFDVVKRAPGKSLSEIKAMLSKAFAERGLTRQPGPWLDAVASDAAFGKTYIVDLPAAVAADSIETVPDPQLEAALRERRILRSESVTEGQESERVMQSGEDGPTNDEAAHPAWTSDASRRRRLALFAGALALALAAAAVTMARRRAQVAARS